jgi:short-subunit dehydrogenase
MRARPLERGRALVTGASAGIGEAFARHFAAQGFDLVLVARSADKLEKIAADLRAGHAVDVRELPCDLLDPEAPANIMAACADLEIDVLVNNAGLMYHGDFCDQDESSMAAVIQLNIAALTRLTRLFLTPMLERKRGRILNLTSTTGFQAAPTVAVYAASKAYILSFTEALAEELRGTGVYATALAPGPTDTHMMADSFGEELQKESFTTMLMVSTDFVAAEGFRACMAGETICIPGRANNAFTAISRLQPRWLSRRLQAYLYRKLGEV